MGKHFALGEKALVSAREGWGPWVQVRNMCEELHLPVDRGCLICLGLGMGWSKSYSTHQALI